MFIKHGFSRILSFSVGIFAMISVFFYSSLSVHAVNGFFDISATELIGSSFKCDDLIYGTPEEFLDMEPGLLYRVDYSYDARFILGSDCVLKNFMISLDLRESFDVVDYSFSLLNIQSDYIVSSNEARFSDSGSFIIKAPQSFGSNYITLDVSGFLDEFDAPISSVLNALSFIFTVDSITCLTVDETQVYEDGFNDGFVSGFEQGVELGENRGYESGYDEGLDAGYDLGYESGYDEGLDAGYDTGFDHGYSSGSSAGFDSGYDTGFDRGYATGAGDGYDEGYDAGFDAGADSVDTDSFYAAGFEAGESSGYNEGYEVGYDAAYESAYEQGYNQAVENLTGSGVVQNQSTHITKSLSLNNNSLDIEDVNTTLPVVYQQVSDLETYLDDSLSTGYITNGEYFHIEYDDSTYLLEGDFSADTYDKSVYTFGTMSKDYTYGLGYFVGGVQKLFTASTDAYAYKVYIKQKDVDYTRTNVWKAWNIVGTHSDVLEGSADLGSRFYQGSSLEHYFFIYTDNLPVDIYSGVLVYFLDDDKTSASIDLTADLSITFTPYTRTEYNQIIESVNNLGGKIDDLGDDLMHGYDSSAGAATNTQLKGSVDSYGSMENTLFDSVSGGLSDYEFFDFSSVPAMITGLSFIGSIFLSWFNAAGGASGVGIVLSVLFSVMLVAMALGLYRLYQNASHRKP